MLRGTLACGVALAAAGLVLTGPAAYGDTDLTAPYARAAAIVDADGALNNGKNVVTSWRVSTGRYCVQIDRRVAASGGLVQLTPRAPRRLPFVAFRSPSSICSASNTVTVGVYDTSSGRLADGGFDLSIV
jgi:hypothetical protein